MPGIILVMGGIIIFLSIKLRKARLAREEREKEISEINTDLRESNVLISNQKELISREHNESEKFYGMLVQAADDGISFYDRDWKLKFANAAFYSMIGLDNEPDSSRYIQDLIQTFNSEFPGKKMEALSHSGFYESDIRVKHKDGHFLSLSTRSVIVRSDNGEVLGSLTISRDITRLKQVHEDLIKANNEAEASNRLKSTFLANISHEIRTPLNSVVGFSNLLLSDGLTDNVKGEYIGHINHNSEKLLQIIGDIIDLSRLENSQIEITYEETSLSSIVNEVIQNSKQIISRNEKSIVLNVKNEFRDEGDLIFTDRIWLKRVLNHLMDNAIKFTLEGLIEFSYQRENDNILFKIKDTGIGIKEENLRKIFDEFHQEINGHHRPFEGLGVGLTLAKEVVERMGGRIFVKSEKGIGSEFSFSLPYRPAGSTKVKLSVSKNRNEKSISWNSKKILLVNDDREALLYLNRIMLDTGVSIVTARSGMEAIRLIKTTPDIDIVLLDMQMAEMNGIEVTLEIRKIRKNLPVIAQTAFVFEDDRDIILEAGCSACLIKPVKKEDVIKTMSAFLN